MFNFKKKKKEDTKPKLDIRDSIKKIGNNISEFKLKDGRFVYKNLTIVCWTLGDVTSLRRFKKRKDSHFNELIHIDLSQDEKDFLSEKLKKKIETNKKNKIQEDNKFLNSIKFK